MSAIILFMKMVISIGFKLCSMKTTKKGIYCIEGLWDHTNIKDKSTVLPILNLLENRGYCNFIHHSCATREELVFFLNKWKQKSVSIKYPILYLAFHGQEEGIFLNSKDCYTMEELSQLLEDKCLGNVIHFGSCSTLRMDKRKIQTFLNKTGAIATIGYKEEIDWLLSTVCDLLIFEALQQDKFDSKGIRNIERKIFNEYGNLNKILNLRMVVNEKIHFPRERVKK